VETPRLTLRRFTRSDADNLLSLDSDPEVMRYLTGGVPTPRVVIETEILPRFLGSYESSAGLGYFAAVERSTGDFLGWFGLVPREPGASRDVSLGYRLRRSAWGKGYATEGVQALIREGFTMLGVERISATTYQDNLASRRVMEKSGMALVRTFRMTPMMLAAAGTFQAGQDQLWDGDDLEYALTKADWERQAHGGAGRPHHATSQQLPYSIPSRSPSS